MSQKLNQEELEQFRSYRSEANQLASVLGEITYQKVIIEAELGNVKESILANVKSQNEFMKQLGQKYGDGSINLETGEISSLETK